MTLNTIDMCTIITALRIANSVTDAPCDNDTSGAAEIERNFSVLAMMVRLELESPSELGRDFHLASAGCPNPGRPCAGD